MNEHENITNPKPKPNPKFWICRPHEGPEEFEFDLVSIIFSDKAERFICKSDIVPPDYIPNVVYSIDETCGVCHEVGSYKKENGEYFLVPSDLS
jgi:hypothetical protein